MLSPDAVCADAEHATLFGTAHLIAGAAFHRPGRRQASNGRRVRFYFKSSIRTS